MGKHRTSASLGHPNQYTSPASSEPMPEPENIYTNVESLERRVSTLEGLLNDVMHQIDKPVKNQSFGNGGLPSKAKPHKKGKPDKPAPKQPSKGKGNSPEQEALRNACEQQVLDFLADGKVIDRREVHDQMPDHEYSKGLMRRALHALAEAGKVKITKTEDMSVSYVSIAKQCGYEVRQ